MAIEQKIKWDEIGERQYETGIDRGVLYLPDDDDPAVAWNGLVSVTENLERETKSCYINGIKYLDYQILGEFSGKIQAFTYPDQLEKAIGISTFLPGVFLHDQRPKTFGLSYRTRVGNDLDGTDHGYKIHLLYNVLAEPNSTQYSSIAENTSPLLFEWNLSSVPSVISEARPTAHIVLDSRSMASVVLYLIELLLYGTVDEDADIDEVGQLPPLSDLLDLISGYYDAYVF